MKILFYTVIITLLSLSGDLFSQQRTPFQNYKIFPSGVNQIEPLISRHPLNHLIMFASAYTLNNATLVRNEGVYVTTNGGTNWFGWDIVNDGYVNLHNGDPGPVIDKDGNFIIAHFGPALIINRIYSNTSVNYGTNWSAPYAVFSNTNNSQDKGTTATDDVPTSPYFGRSYCAASMLTSAVPIIFAYTTNSGTTWEGYYQINQSLSGRNSYGPAISVNHEGKIYASWSSTIISSPFNEVSVGFWVSVNGGENWSVWESAYQTNGIKQSSMPPWGIRVNGYPSMDVDKSGGPRNGWIYIATGERNLSPAGNDPDIVLHKSTNGGLNWSEGVRVNQDPVNNGKIQYFPAMRVDEQGGINILYYDTRNCATNDSVDLYISRSTDGGNTFYDVLISNNKFYPQPIALGGAGNQGDNISMTSGAGKLWPVWMAKYPGDNVYQIWTAPIDINSINVRNISVKVPSEFELFQNYPNPFNSYSVIRFNIKEPGNVTLKIYDITGKLLSLSVNSYFEAGSYEYVFDGSGFSSGLYYYVLKSGNKSEFRKMMLIK